MAMSKDTNKLFGDFGESLVLSRIIAHTGYAWKPTGNKCGDVICDIARIEVKISHLNSEGRYKFCLWKKHHTDYKDSHYVVLITVSPENYINYFVIPSDDISGKQIAIPAHLGGKWSEYKNNWGVLYGN